MSRVQLMLCLLLCAPIARADTELLPDPSLRLDAARYDPVAPDLHWDTWIGAGTGIARVRNATLAFRADVETTAGNTRRAFDATQANYHLEPSLSLGLSGQRTLGVFYHHVSRHEIDRQGVRASQRRSDRRGRLQGPSAPRLSPRLALRYSRPLMTFSRRRSCASAALRTSR